VIASFSPKRESVPTSSVKSIDFKASRELMDLPGGPLGLTLGGEMRWEAANTPAVPGTDTGSIVGLGYSQFTATRRVNALFAEVNAPVAKWLELSAAARYDHYSDFGDSLTPKLGFKFKPMDQFAIRGTYAEAFRAPGPAERGGSSFGFTTYGILSQGNPNLKPEKAKSYTLDVIAEPMPGASATIDYWKVDRKNEIVQADPNAIVPAGQCTAGCDGTPPGPGLPPKPNRVNQRFAGLQPNTFLYYDSQGNLTVTGFENATSTKTDGVDVELRHRMSLGEAGRLTAQLNWSHTLKIERTGVDGVTVDYAGNARSACAERRWRFAEGQGDPLADVGPRPLGGDRCDQLRGRNQDDRPQGRDDAAGH
jgi:iron complex outermembrane receptor protein